METGLLHLHTKLIVPLFLLLFTARVVLLVVNQHNLLATLNGKVKWVRIGLETLMLLTGLYLIVSAPEGLATYNVLKYIVLLAGIVVGVIAFKKKNKVLAVFALALMLYIYPLSLTRSPLLQSEPKRVQAAITQLGSAGVTPELRGQVIYEQACNRCHGPAGNSQWMKSKNLTTSMLVEQDVAKIIKLGSAGVGRESKLMPAYEYLTDDQIADLVAYINRLKMKAKGTA